jgi:hypothetical protein
MAAALPAAAKEPRARRVAKIHSNGSHRRPRNGLDDAMEFVGFQREQAADGTEGMNASLPEDLVGHPIADSRKAVLQEQHSLDGGGAMPGEKRPHPRRGEPPVQQGGRAATPPRRRVVPDVKKGAAKLAGVAENQALPGLAQNEVVVPGREKRGGARGDGSELSSHAEMEAEPGVFGETKEHLLAVDLGIQKGGAGQDFPEGGGVRAAKDAFAGVKVDGDNCLSPPGVPPFSVKLDFRQFGHGDE